MTREPLPGDEAPPTAEAGVPPPTWEADDADLGTWESASGAPKAGAGPGPDDLDDEDRPDPEALVDHSGPLRLSHLMIAIAVIALVLAFGVTVGMMGVVIGPIGLLVLGITAGFVVARLRASRQEALIALLVIAADRGMPLASALSAFADQFRGGYPRRVLGVVAQLRAGRPLPEALGESLPNRPHDPHRMARRLVWGGVGEQVYDELVSARPRRSVSRDAILMARIGHETGLLAPALRLIGGVRPGRVSAWMAVASRICYLLVIMLIAEGIASFQMYFIVPKFEAIFKDFGAALPGITVFLIECSHVLVRNGPITASIMLGQVILLLFLPFSFGGWMNYQVPIFDRLFVRRHTALVLRAISVVIEANKPIGLGLGILAERYPAPWFRRRLARAATHVQMGADWIDALWQAGVIRRADAEVLAAASTVGNLTWACRALADTAERRQQIRVQLLIQALFPTAVVAMGLAVATICVGYFLPLITLIQRLTNE